MLSKDTPCAIRSLSTATTFINTFACRSDNTLLYRASKQRRTSRNCMHVAAKTFNSASRQLFCKQRIETCDCSKMRRQLLTKLCDFSRPTQT